MLRPGRRRDGIPPGRVRRDRRDRLKRLKDGTWVDDKAIPARYPFEFIKADAFDVLADAAFIARFDAIHASWPCQFASIASKYNGHRGACDTDQLTPGRAAMQAAGLPWVIENVPGAPIGRTTALRVHVPGCRACAASDGSRPRWHGFDLNMSHDHREPVITVAGHGPPSWVREGAVPVTTADWKRAMRIDWMTRDGLAQAIPPAYTEWVGIRLLEHLASREAA